MENFKFTNHYLKILNNNMKHVKKWIIIVMIQIISVLWLISYILLLYIYIIKWIIYLLQRLWEGSYPLIIVMIQIISFLWLISYISLYKYIFYKVINTFCFNCCEKESILQFLTISIIRYKRVVVISILIISFCFENNIIKYW